MTMNSSLRKFALTIHIVVSVGWIGAIVAFLSLTLAGLLTGDNEMVFAAWIGMNLIITFVIVPLAFSAFLTGLVMALGTKWGVFQHYWVLISLILTAISLIILVENTRTVNFYAELASRMNSEDIQQLRSGLTGELLHGGMGLLILLCVQALNVYKPRGLTVYGWRKKNDQRIMRRSMDPTR